jgi:hypothetical protein
MSKNTIISIFIIVAALGVVLFLVNKEDQKPGQYDEFASCLAEETTYYGAFWCHNCQAQEALFGRKSKAKLNYVECSTPDGQGQTDVCIEAGIESYPTWEFSDGERLMGVTQLETLAEKTSCELPS